MGGYPREMQGQRKDPRSEASPGSQLRVEDSHSPCPAGARTFEVQTRWSRGSLSVEEGSIETGGAEGRMRTPERRVESSRPGAGGREPAPEPWLLKVTDGAADRAGGRASHPAQGPGPSLTF